MTIPSNQGILNAKFWIGYEEIDGTVVQIPDRTVLVMTVTPELAQACFDNIRKAVDHLTSSIPSDLGCPSLGEYDPDDPVWAWVELKHGFASVLVERCEVKIGLEHSYIRDPKQNEDYWLDFLGPLQVLTSGDLSTLV